MNKLNSNIILKVGVLLALLFSLGFNLYQQRQIKELNSELEISQSRNDNLETQISNLKDELVECESQIGDFRIKDHSQSWDNRSLESEKDYLEYEKRSLEYKVSSLEDKIDDLESELDYCNRKLRNCN